MLERLRGHPLTAPRMLVADAPIDLLAKQIDVAYVDGILDEFAGRLYVEGPFGSGGVPVHAHCLLVTENLLEPVVLDTCEVANESEEREV